jgi:hypothetical protein
LDLIFKRAFSQQFDATIQMLEQAINACPDQLWTIRLWEDEVIPQSAEFWYITFHTLFWLDLYFTGSVDGFFPPAPFTLDELDPAGIIPVHPYKKEELLTYLEHCRIKCQTTINNLNDEKAEQICSFTWGELTFAALQLDNMRHVQEHVAQLNMILGQQTGWSPRWLTNAKKPGG